MLGCVIIPVRNFKTSHHPHYPLPCEFRHNAQSKISNLNHTLFQFFKVFDSAVKVVLYFIFSNVTVPAVWFPFTTSTSSTLSLDMTHSSVVVTFPCKEIKNSYYNNSSENNTKVEWIAISLRESLVSPCGNVRSPFHYTTGSELLEELPHKNVTSATCYFYM